MIRSVLTVARREIRGLIDHPTAYVLALAFLGIALFLTFRNMYAMGIATLRPLFDLLPMLLAVLIPALTMRSLAEEKRARTLEWLMSQPVGEAEVVLGKFLGAWAFVLVVLAGTVPMAIGIIVVSEADPGIVIAQYAGAILLAAELTAIGIWASSVTRNQITSFIVASVIGFILFLIGLPGIQMGAPAVIARVLGNLSVLTHFENVARGVIDLRDVVYFVSVAALFVVLAIASVSRARLSASQPEWTRLRIGTALVAVIVLAVNLLGGRIGGRLDLTRAELFTLSDGSRQVLGGLDDIVAMTLFASSELPPEVQLQLRDVRDLLSDMESSAGGSLVVTEVNPDEDPAAAGRATALGIQPLEFNVLRDDEFDVRRGYYGLAITYADEEEIFPVIDRTDDLEYRLVSAVSRMTTEDRPRVLFVTDGGAVPAGGMPGVQEVLSPRYDLASRSIAGDSTIAPTVDSFAVMVVTGPSEPLDTLVVDRIRSFVDSGGAALLLVDPVQIDQEEGVTVPVQTGLEPLLEEWGLRITPSLVVDLASAERISLGQQMGGFSVVAPYPLWPLALPAGDHVVTRGLRALSLGWAGALEIVDSTGIVPLWTTSEDGGLRDPYLPINPQQEWDLPPDSLGVRVVAAAVDPTLSTAGEAPVAAPAGGPGRMVVVGDATFSELEFVQSNQQNLIFLANAIDWLAQDELLISIRSKDRTPPALVFTSEATRSAIRWGNLIGVPALFALFGVVRVTGRRRRAEGHWKKVITP
jgi:ABC-2 type transport system permease protein